MDGHSMTKTKHNGFIDLCRFLASYGILYFHLGAAPFLGEQGLLNAGLFVEFFFLLTGYFSVAHIVKHKREFQVHTEIKTMKYIGRKWLQFLPYSISATTLQYIYLFCKNDFSVSECVKKLFMFPFEAFLLRNTGVNLTGVAGTLWYLSAMLIVLPIILYIVIKEEDKFKYYFSYILPLFIYGFLVRKIGTIRTTDWIYSTLRAYAGISLGGGGYFLVAFEGVK